MTRFRIVSPFRLLSGIGITASLVSTIQHMLLGRPLDAIVYALLAILGVTVRIAAAVEHDRP